MINFLLLFTFLQVNKSGGYENIPPDHLRKKTVTWKAKYGKYITCTNALFSLALMNEILLKARDWKQ